MIQINQIVIFPLAPWRELVIDEYCYTTKFNFSFQKGFDGYCDYFLADCFICE